MEDYPINKGELSYERAVKIVKTEETRKARAEGVCGYCGVEAKRLYLNDEYEVLCRKCDSEVSV